MLAIVVGGAVLTGWMFDVTGLKSFLSGGVTMKANTALAFVAIGIALWLAHPAATPTRVFFIRLCAGLAGLIGLMTLGEYVFGWNPGFDQWLFRERTGAVGTSHPGRMAPNTALCFVLSAVGIALLAERPASRRRPAIAASCGLLVLSVALCAIPTHVIADTRPLGWWGLTQMAVPTAALFGLLGGVVTWIGWRQAVGETNLSHFSAHVWRTVGCVAALVIAFAVDVRSRQEIHRAFELREQSFLLADELRRSSDDLTRMARTYVVTGDPVYKRRFQEILASREGRIGRPEDYSRRFWELVLGDTTAPGGRKGAAPLLDGIRQGGFTEEEFGKLAAARANSVALTALELEALRLVEAGGPEAESNRTRARLMTHDEKYYQAQLTVMSPIDDFVVLVDQRTRAAVRAAEKSATIFSYLLAAAGMGLVFTLWRAYVVLNDTLGGSVDALSAHIARIGNGDFTAEIRVEPGDERSVLGWLAETRGKLQRNMEQLRESEANFRLLAEAMPQIVWATRADGWNTYFNQQWVDYTGMTLEESYGHGWNTPFHPDDRQRAWDAWQNATKNLATYSLECRLRRADGVYRWWLVRGVPQRDADGNILKWFGTCTDIHDLKIAEEENRRLNADLEQRVSERTRELATSEEQLRSVLQATATGTFDIDLQTGEGRWNDVEFELLGLEPGAVPPSPETFFRYVHPDDLGPLHAQWEEAKRKGNLDAEFRVVRADGEVRWLAGKGHFTYARQAGTDSSVPWGEPHRFLGVNYDITERKHAEQALRQAREDLDRAQMVGQIGSWRLDVRHNTLTWSEENHRIFGLPEGTPLTYESFLAIVHPDDRAMVDDQWRAGLRGAPYDIEHRLVVNGKVKWVREKAYLEHDQAGQLLGGFGITQDITDRKRSELELRNLTAELQSANRELESFSYSVSHDLRAPLRAVDGFSRIALTKHLAELSPAARDALQIVRNSAQQMGRLIDDLLAFARMSRQSVRKQTVSCLTLVQECLETLHPEIEGRPVEITIGALPACSADPGLLKLVWMNLLSNALKFTRRRDPAQIEIGFRQNGDTVYFVRDNGVGFKMTYADKLFGVFQRLHRAEDFEGTGVGLATTQRIVQRHGGRIWVEAELNRGATFYFTLAPAGSARAAVDLASPPVSASPFEPRPAQAQAQPELSINSPSPPAPPLSL